MSGAGGGYGYQPRWRSKLGLQAMRGVDSLWDSPDDEPHSNPAWDPLPYSSGTIQPWFDSGAPTATYETEEGSTFNADDFGLLGSDGYYVDDISDLSSHDSPSNGSPGSLSPRSHDSPSSPSSTSSSFSDWLPTAGGYWDDTMEAGCDDLESELSSEGYSDGTDGTDTTTVMPPERTRVTTQFVALSTAPHVTRPQPLTDNRLQSQTAAAVAVSTRPRSFSAAKAVQEILMRGGKVSHWTTVEALLLDDSYNFEIRPWVEERDCAVYREGPKISRHGRAPVKDTWINSGGQRGSRLIPGGRQHSQQRSDNSEIPKIRCRYGKIKCADGRLLKYHEYTLLDSEYPAEASTGRLKRHLFVVFAAIMASHIEEGKIATMFPTRNEPAAAITAWRTAAQQTASRVDHRSTITASAAVEADSRYGYVHLEQSPSRVTSTPGVAVTNQTSAQLLHLKREYQAEMSAAEDPAEDDGLSVLFHRAVSKASTHRLDITDILALLHGSAILAADHLPLRPKSLDPATFELRNKKWGGGLLFREHIKLRRSFAKPTKSRVQSKPADKWVNGGGKLNSVIIPIPGQPESHLVRRRGKIQRGKMPGGETIQRRRGRAGETDYSSLSYEQYTLVTNGAMFDQPDDSDNPNNRVLYHILPAGNIGPSHLDKKNPTKQPSRVEAGYMHKRSGANAARKGQKSPSTSPSTSSADTMFSSDTTSMQFADESQWDLLGVGTTLPAARQKRKKISAIVAATLTLTCVVLAQQYLLGDSHGISTDDMCHDGTYQAATQLKGEACLPCTSCGAALAAVVASCTVESNTACSVPMWEKISAVLADSATKAEIVVTGPIIKRQSGASADADDVLPMSSSTKPTAPVQSKRSQDRTFHTAQMSSAWTENGSSTFVFGGADSSLAEPLYSKPPAQHCYTGMIGHTSELWRASIHRPVNYGKKVVEWYFMGGGVDRSNVSSELVLRAAEEEKWPRARAAAVTWQVDLTGGDGVRGTAGIGGVGTAESDGVGGGGGDGGLLFSGEFNFCDYDRWSLRSTATVVAGTGVTPSPCTYTRPTLDDELQTADKAAKELTNPDDSDNSNNIWYPPDSLYVHDSSSGGWSLLGGSDCWLSVSSLDWGPLLQSGRTTRLTPPGVVPTTTKQVNSMSVVQWPLSRSRAQAFTAGASNWLFSGLMTVVTTSQFEGHKDGTESLGVDHLMWLYTDMWQITPPMKQAELLDERFNKPVNQWSIRMVAMSGYKIETPIVLGLGRTVASTVNYPGPRMSASTWSASSIASHNSAQPPKVWMFGGIGQRSVDSATQAGNVAIDGSTGWTTNLCDLWSFEPSRPGGFIGTGWQLTSACSRDLPELHMSGKQPLLDLLQLHPTAGLFTTTWVADTGIGGDTALAMFGGVTECRPYDGTLAHAGVMSLWQDWRDWKDSNSVGPCPVNVSGANVDEIFSDMTMCDLYFPRSLPTSTDPNIYPYTKVRTFAADECGAELWSFDLTLMQWHTLPRPPVPDGGESGKPSNGGRQPDPPVKPPSSSPSPPWPEPTCGAHAVTHLTATAEANTQLKLQPLLPGEALMLGGWSGDTDGECDPWPEEEPPPIDTSSYSKQFSSPMNDLGTGIDTGMFCSFLLPNTAANTADWTYNRTAAIERGGMNTSDLVCAYEACPDEETCARRGVNLEMCAFCMVGSCDRHCGYCSPPPPVPANPASTGRPEGITGGFYPFADPAVFSSLGRFSAGMIVNGSFVASPSSATDAVWRPSPALLANPRASCDGSSAWIWSQESTPSP